MADNINISPDMVNNLVNMLKNNGFGDNANNFEAKNSNSETNNQTVDNSSSNYSNANSSNADNSNTNSSTINNFSNGIDFETLMKMKSIMETLNNSNDQDSKLLYSLKPYLRKSRQEKLDQYINLLKITQVSKLFNTKS